MIFSFNWIDTDAVEVECTVTGIDNAEIDIKATVGEFENMSQFIIPDFIKMRMSIRYISE